MMPAFYLHEESNHLWSPVSRAFTEERSLDLHTDMSGGTTNRISRMIDRMSFLRTLSTYSTQWPSTEMVLPELAASTLMQLDAYS